MSMVTSREPGPVIGPFSTDDVKTVGIDGTGVEASAAISVASMGAGRVLRRF